MKPCYLIFTLLICCMACKKDLIPKKEGNFKLNFEHKVGTSRLTLGTTTYKNPSAESYTVTAFKYFISNVYLVKMDNSLLRLPISYHLVDESKPESKSILLLAPQGEYRAIGFKLGVDSTRNVSGAQTDALDPVLGMFWSWNSGYIMAKMEGASPVSAAPDKKLTFHVGGFKGQYNAVQDIRIQTPISINVGPDREPAVTFTTDLNAWFGPPNIVSFATMATIHSPGEAAWKISVNYKNMFRITNVTDL
ncbi:MbnP family protein [Chitinophaga caseinilytica]|uniref:MbnP family protein n=1 Tax=Chitinophaga caseinilytica TaxID=2267521 RepID=UPI003C2DCE2A